MKATPKRTSATDKVNALVRKVIEAMADPSNLVSDDVGQYCPYCDPVLDSYYEFEEPEADYPHEADCPVLLARKLLSENDPHQFPVEPQNKGEN